MKLVFLKKILSKIMGRSEPELPFKYALVDYSGEAKDKGLIDNINKVISVYEYDSLIGEHRVVEEKLYNRTVHETLSKKMAVTDVTKKEVAEIKGTDVEAQTIEYEDKK